MICSITICNRSTYAKELCELHWRRLKKNGSTLSNKPPAPHEKHNMTGTPEHRAWISMRRRCYLKTFRQYKDYGGRGIVVCDEWRNSFSAFYKYIGNKPSPQHTLDRKNSDGNYEPRNVRWADRYTQAMNKTRLKSTKTSGYRGVSRKRDKWRARFHYYGEVFNLGSFNTKEEAAYMYDCFALALYGEEAKTNFEYC